MMCLRLGLPLQGFHAGRSVGDYAAEVCVRVLAGWELYRKLVLQRHPTHVLHPRVTVLIVKALKHEATCTSANSHPTSVEGALHIGKVRTACSAYCGKGAPALMLVRCSSRWPWRRSS